MQSQVVSNQIMYMAFASAKPANEIALVTWIGVPSIQASSIDRQRVDLQYDANETGLGLV